MDVASCSLFDFVAQRCERTPQLPFISQYPDLEAHTYHQLWDTSLRMAAFLGTRSVGPKDRVALIGANDWTLYPLLVACAARRAMLVPIDPGLHADERASIIDHAEPALVITSHALPKSTAGKPNRPTILLNEFLQALPALEPSAGTVAKASASDDVLLVYSSGTTGSAKGIVLSQGSLAWAAKVTAEFYGIGPADSMFCILPTFHMNAIMATGLAPLAGGAHVVLSDVFSVKNAKFYWERVRQQRVTIASLVPSIMALFLQLHPGGNPAPSHNLRFALCGAAPLPASLWRRFEETFDVPVYQGYGLTETSFWAAFTPPGRPRKYETVGIPVGCEIVIDQSPLQTADYAATTDDRQDPSATDGAERAGVATRGRRGEVLIRTPAALTEYYKNPALTASTRTADNFFRTGDIGFFDEDGLLYISGRLKDIIIKNGVNIFPDDIDATVLHHGAVESCKTVGISDPLVGERIVTACVLKPDAPSVSESDLRSRLHAEISAFKLPDRIVFMGYLPKGATGKIGVGTLRAILSGQLAAEIEARLTESQFNRAQPSGREDIARIIRESLHRGSPIRFLSYWGAGARDGVNDIDRMALERLSTLVASVGKVREVPGRLTLVLTDVHAIDINMKPRLRVERYFEEIAQAAEPLGFEVLRLSDLWRDAGLSVESVRATIRGREFEAAWQQEPLREQLLVQAQKHSEGDQDTETAAEAYYLACRRERVAMLDRFRDHIFITYNDPTFDGLLPDLPKVYIYSHKEDSSLKPWFTDAAEPANLTLVFEHERQSGQEFRISGPRAKYVIETAAGAPGRRFPVGLLEGPIGSGKVREIGSDSVTLACTFVGDPPARPLIDLILAVPKPKELKRMLPNIAALGVDRIFLVRTWRAPKTNLETDVVKPDMYRPLLHAGMAQCATTREPRIVIEPLFRPFVEDRATQLFEGATKLVIQPSSERQLASIRIGEHDRVAVMIGPEGGLIPYEIDALRRVGFLPVTAGSNGVRAEISTIAVLSQIDLLRRQSSSV